jgi:prepilin-type N-terminal cleavage/methylation domain-containing protein
MRAGRSPSARRPTARGLTLIEVMITVAILGILAAILLPQLSSGVPERLAAAAEILVGEFDFARGLAVTNNSQYRLNFEPDENRYVLRHSGSNNLLNVLPESPFGAPDDPPDERTTDLDDLPLPDPPVRLLGALRMAGLGQETTVLEFQPLGGTTANVETVVWLACGEGSDERFISVHIHPVTGLAEAGALVAELPSGVAAALDVD